MWVKGKGTGQSDRNSGTQINHARMTVTPLDDTCGPTKYGQIRVYVFLRWVPWESWNRAILDCAMHRAPRLLTRPLAVCG
jgi:hypothetical protein